MNPFLLSPAWMALPIQSNKVNNETAEKGEGEMSKIKVSSIPLYPEPEKYNT